MPTYRELVQRRYRLARRVLTITLAGLGGLVVAAMLAPTVRREIVLTRLDASDATTRARALEAALPMARDRARVRRMMLDTLVRLVVSGDEIAQLQTRVAGGWLLREVPPFRDLLERKLDEAHERQFIALARLLHMTGHWDTPDRTTDERLRWLAHRYESDPDHAATVRALGRVGRCDDPRAGQLLDHALNERDAAVRLAVVEEAPAVLGQDATDLLCQALSDDDHAVRARTCQMLATLNGTREARAALRDRLTDVNADVRRAALWTLDRWGAEPDSNVAKIASELLASDPSPTVRAAAAGLVHDNAALVKVLRHNDDVMLRARCVRSLTAPLDEVAADAVLACLRSERKYWVVMAAIRAADRHLREAPSVSSTGFADQGMRDALLARLEACLRSDEGDLAAACVEALGASRDEALLPLLRDLAVRYRSHPWVAVTAARAAYKIDPEIGRELLLDLLSLEPDAPRDRVLAELAWLDDTRIDDSLRERLRSTDSRVRGGACLALAIRLRRHGRSDDALLDYVTQRTDPDSPKLETRTPLLGTYLAARIVLVEAEPTLSLMRPSGDDVPEPRPNDAPHHSAEPEPQSQTNDVTRRLLDMMTAGAAPPSTACLALLVARDRTALDAILLDTSRMPPGFDARALLCDDRFGEILTRVMPDAPVPTWTDDPALQAWLTDRLRDWWRVPA